MRFFASTKKNLTVLLAISLLVFLPAAVSAGSIEAEFNEPPSADGLQQKLLNFIDSASSSLDVAIYSFRSQPVVDHLLSAKESGVEVRVVTEKENREKDGTYGTGSGPYFDQLVDSGIEVKVDDRSSALMHHKFIVADGERVLTGSTNFTESQINGDKNNIITLDSSGVAYAYTQEFEEMWNGRFGASKNNSPTNSYTVDGSRVIVLFSPNADIRDTIDPHLNSADNSVYFNTFAFTDSDLSNKLINMYESGIAVRGTMDAWKASDGYYNEYSTLSNAGVPVSMDAYDGIMHDKYFVVDGNSPASEPRVLTGSYNYTASADESNDENMVIVLDEEVASAYHADAVNTYQNHSKDPAPPLTAKINVNTAGETTLTKLDGIGTVTAQDIINNREANGVYTSRDDLTRVEGIGPTTVDNIRSDITVGEVAAEKININTADNSTLQELESIGPATAENIINYRDANGDFAATDEIQNVDGIGPATYETIKGDITVGNTDSGGESLVNINTADSSTLQQLENIGPATAENIISYRDTYGDFASTEEIQNVSGIGPTTYDAIKDEITVGEPLININTADRTKLQELTGIGPSTADNIISYRDSSGSFTRKTDLKNVDGIGDATYSSLEDEITVE